MEKIVVWDIWIFKIFGVSAYSQWDILGMGLKSEHNIY